MTIAGHGEKCAHPLSSRLEQRGPQRCVWACERLMVNSVTLAPLGMLQAGAFPVSRRWMNAGVNELWLPWVPLHLFLSPPPHLHGSRLSLISRLNVYIFKNNCFFFCFCNFIRSLFVQVLFCNLDINVLKRYKWSRMDLFCAHVDIHRSRGGSPL